MSLLKPEIRELLRALRRLMTAEYRQQASLQAAQHFKQSPFFNHQRLACYMAMPEEMDTLPIIQTLWQADKQCYLPVISQEKILSFARHEKNTQLALNRYQVLEPLQPSETLAGSELDVVLVPLVAFDNKGNRLGTGGGYYDRTFSFMLDQNEEKRKPHLVGLAYELQKVDHLPQEAFDVPLAAVVTEAGLTIF